MTSSGTFLCCLSGGINQNLIILSFSGFDFFTGDDPTNGNVDYVDQGTAQSDNLAYVQSDNTTVLAVDNTSKLSVGQNRKSVRISSKATYSSGLVIADIAAMPHGCSVWPAFWMVGSDWPNHGEIDIIEGVNRKYLYPFSSALARLDYVPTMLMMVIVIAFREYAEPNDPAHRRGLLAR